MTKYISLLFIALLFSVSSFADSLTTNNGTAAPGVNQAPAAGDANLNNNTENNTNPSTEKSEADQYSIKAHHYNSPTGSFHGPNGGDYYKKDNGSKTFEPREEGQD